jgi:hypothetical protein
MGAAVEQRMEQLPGVAVGPDNLNASENCVVVW